VDPFAEKQRNWKIYAAALLVAMAVGVLWQLGYPARWFASKPVAPASSPAK